MGALRAAAESAPRAAGIDPATLFLDTDGPRLLFVDGRFEPAHSRPGPVQLTQCLNGTPGDCSLEGSCATKAHWPLINRSVRQALADVTLAAIVAAAVPAKKVVA